MSKTINIFLDHKAVLWGDNTHLNHNDNPFRGNIKADTSIDSNGYLIDSNLVQLTYSNSIFTSPKPVKLVIREGSSVAVDLETVYANAGQSLMSSYTGLRPTLNGSTIRASSTYSGTAFMFGILNDTAKKIDGNDAANDTEAVYFEIVWQIGKIIKASDFVGIQAKIIDFPQSFGHYLIGPGYLRFNKSNLYPNGGRYLANIGDISWKGFIYGKQTNDKHDIASHANFNSADGKVVRYELGESSEAAINVTDGIIAEYATTYDNSLLYYAPFIYIAGSEYTGNSDPLELDDVKIIITNPA